MQVCNKGLLNRTLSKHFLFKKFHKQNKEYITKCACPAYIHNNLVLVTQDGQTIF